MTFDRFHVMKLVGEAVDEVRRLERAEQPALRGTRYTWLKNPANLTGAQFEGFLRLSELNLKTTKAYQTRLNVQEAWTRRGARTARRLLREWCGWGSPAQRACPRAKPIAASSRWRESPRRSGETSAGSSTTSAAA